jgi:hypothetical protein
VKAGAELEQRRLAPLHPDAAFGRVQDAGDRLEQRRLARPVDAHHAKDLAGVQAQVNLAQRPDIDRLQTSLRPAHRQLLQPREAFARDAEAHRDPLQTDRFDSRRR